MIVLDGITHRHLLSKGINRPKQTEGLKFEKKQVINICFFHQCQIQHGATSIAKVIYLNYTMCVVIINVNVRNIVHSHEIDFPRKVVDFKIRWPNFSKGLKQLGRIF